MAEFKISNGYFHLWKTCLHSKALDWQDLNLSSTQQQQLAHILSLPVDSQSELDFFLDIIHLSQQQWYLPHLVLDMARCITPANFGVLGYMASSSNSVAQMLQYVLRFHRLVIDGTQLIPLQIEQASQEIRLYWPLVDEKNIVLCELTLAAMVHLARQMFPAHEFLLKQVEFVNTPQVSFSNYQKFFQCQLRFQQPYYALTFASDNLTLRPQQADSTLIQLLVKQAEAALAQKSSPPDMTRKIHWIVGEYLQQQQQVPSIALIADELHVSVRSLQRALNRQNTSFQHIIDWHRMKRCEALLAQQESLSHIAEQLGYSDQSALARAYKRVQGRTLLEFRKGLPAGSHQEDEQI